jgi:hypothetical protein
MRAAGYGRETGHKAFPGGELIQVCRPQLDLLRSGASKCTNSRQERQKEPVVTFSIPMPYHAPCSFKDQKPLTAGSNLCHRNRRAHGDLCTFVETTLEDRSHLRLYREIQLFLNSFAYRDSRIGCPTTGS